MSRTARLIVACALAALALSGAAEGKMSVFDSPHNLSAFGGRNRASGRPGVTFGEETQVCVFCHVPHNAKHGTPLWSRDIPDNSIYQPYNQSSTLNASPKPGLPTGASRLCLSCHDGTLALGQYARTRVNGDNRAMPVDQVAGASAAFNATINPNLSRDLRDDHPISFNYTDELASKSQLVRPSALPPSIRLDSSGRMECTACHDPHDTEYGNFLVMNNGSDNPASRQYMTGSPLCTSCHQPDGWQGTKHNNTSVPALGHQCLSCHTVHSAPGAVRLLSQVNMEDNCLVTCHNENSSGAPSKNMKPVFRQGMYRHPVDEHNNSGLDHDEKETLPVPASNYHVQCVDCHNPHQANSADSPLSDPPRIDGRLKGVRKDTAGNYAETEYDICFKCHSGGGAARFAGVTVPPPNRVFREPNEKERFNAMNPSFHPVMAPRRGTGASLLPTLQAKMFRIYCTDCHNSDQSAKALGLGDGPNGPHGSQFPHILIARYYMPQAGGGAADREGYSSSLYSLCFRCHSETYIMSTGTAFQNAGANEHTFHVRDQGIPCFACHDAHGVPSSNGTVTTRNGSHLINFDRDYAGTATLTPSYDSPSSGTGSCTVACHTVGGTTHSYSPSGAGANALRLQRALAPRRR